MSSTETPARRSSGAAASLKARERFECRSLTFHAGSAREAIAPTESQSSLGLFRSRRADSRARAASMASPRRERKVCSAAAKAAARSATLAPLLLPACCGYCMSQSPNERTMASGSAAASSASARSHGSSKPASHAKALSRKPSRITSPRLRGGGPRGRYGPAVALGWTKARLCSAETRWRRRRRRDGSAATNSKAAHLERSVGGRRSKRTQLSE
mmetsp:Transcript_7089/g.22311  ORF Transcript_7089/g.22311 Transcript_7089/m.22311 type:complete len:215 (+) Transcript_7089:876-1520(+)